MPLRATTPAGDIHAFEFDEMGWTALKADYRDLRLAMPCCGAPAIPKTSTLGNFFFAHASKGECTTAPESAEHLYCKGLIAQAANGAGWKVTTERPGATPTGDGWVADVFCEKGKVRIAFEVQMSPQSLEETNRRQTRYKDSNVRGAWFLGTTARLTGQEFGQSTPAFTLSPVEIGRPPLILEFGEPLPGFVEAMLNKRLKWLEPEVDQPLQVEFLVDKCWSCKKPVKQVYGYQRSLEDAQGEWHERAFTVATLSDALERVQRLVSADELEALELNRVERHNVIHGKPTNYPYVNACRHCGAMQNSFYVCKKLTEVLYKSVGNGPALTGYAPVSRISRAPGRWVLNREDSNRV